MVSSGSQGGRRSAVAGRAGIRQLERVRAVEAAARGRTARRAVRVGQSSARSASFGQGPAWDAKPPPGVEPLERDLFTSKDFYQDRDEWLNPRYWRCNSPRQIADMRSGGAGAGTSDPRIGANPPVSARWGDCAKDWPRENIVSPYPFATAAEHYAALKADARKRGGPTKHTYESMPKWDGVYGEYLPEGRRVWNYGRATQVPTFLSILTPEYQQRMVRQLYHEGVDAAHQWSASYCWPEGFMRQWATGPKPQRIIVTPEVVMFVGSSSGNIVRIAHLDRELPLGQEIPQWYGDTVAFWDGDALIMHTSNVQAGRSTRRGSSATSSRPSRS